MTGGAEPWRSMWRTKDTALTYLSRIADPTTRTKTAETLGLGEDLRAFMAKAVSAAPDTRLERAGRRPGRSVPAPPDDGRSRAVYAPPSDAEVLRVFSTSPAGVLSLLLPYPPSVNNYYSHILMPCKPVRPGAPAYRVQKVVGKAGKAFRAAVSASIDLLRGHGRVTTPPDARLKVGVDLHPPRNYRSDVDNGMKALLDALSIAGVWGDDTQVDDLHIRRCAKVEGGGAVVRISVISAPLLAAT